MDKDAIKRSFSGAASTYDSNDGVQRDTAIKLAERIGVLIGSGALEFPARKSSPPAAGERAAGERVEGCVPGGENPVILDMGCGTGSLTGEISRIWPASLVTGCDIAFPMLERMRSKLAAAPSAVGDCAALPFSGGSFDMAVSNLALQWTEPRTAFTEAHRVLKPGGLLVFSTLGPGTLRELRECCTQASPGVEFPMEYRSADDLLQYLGESGLEPLSVENHSVFKRYSSMIELVKTLKNIGAAPAARGEKSLSNGVMLRKAGRIYADRYPAPGGGVIATYEVILAAARKR